MFQELKKGYKKLSKELIQTTVILVDSFLHSDNMFVVYIGFVKPD